MDGILPGDREAIVKGNPNKGFAALPFLCVFFARGIRRNRREKKELRKGPQVLVNDNI